MAKVHSDDIKTSAAVERMTSNQKSHYHHLVGNVHARPQEATLQMILTSKVLEGCRGCMAAVLILSVVGIADATTGTCSIMDILMIAYILLATVALIGLYGASRVLKDLQVDDDGIETTGQRIFQFYVHGTCVLMTLCILPSSSLFFFHSELICDEKSHFPTIILPYTIMLPLAISIKYSVAIVTWYEMVQSLQELVCLWMILGSGFIAILSSTTYNRQTFLSAVELNIGYDPMLTFIWIWALCTIGFSAFGFLSGWTESNPGLRLYLILSVILFFAAIGIIVANLTNTIPGVDVINSKCDSVLRLMGSTWFQNFFQCAKYTEITTNTSLYDTVTCGSNNETSVFWENMSTNTSTCSLGCIDHGCCYKVKSSIYTLTKIITIGSIWYLFVMIVGIFSTRNLAVYTSTKTQHSLSWVLRHNHSGNVAALIGVSLCVILALAVGINVGNTYSFMPLELRENMCNFNSSMDIVNNTELVSCDNGIQDGDEVSIDCGGLFCQECATAAPSINDVTHFPTTTSSPTISPSAATNYIGPILTFNFESNDDEVDLKMRFMASEKQMCSIGGITGVNDRCANSKHTTSNTIEIDVLYKTIYVVYIQADEVNRVQGQLTAVDSINRTVANISLPFSDDISNYDLFGYADTSSYSFARMLCLNATGATPTLFDCSEYHMFERRVSSCILNSDTPCKCETREKFFLDQDKDTYGNISVPITTCQKADDWIGLSTNGDDCDDSRSNKNPETNCFLDGWYLDSDTEASSCDDVCSSYHLQCSEYEMSTISSASVCQQKISAALQAWCSFIDTEFTVSTSTGNPRGGGVFQLGLNSDQASCLCKNGVIDEPVVPGIILQGDMFTTLSLGGVFHDAGATCTEEAAALSIDGPDSFDAQGTYVIKYSCCEGDVCVSISRHVMVDENKGDCDSFLNKLSTTEDYGYTGGCVIAGQLFFPMNNNHQGFPIPDDEFYWLTGGNSKCSQVPNDGSSRRVCYCN